MKPSPAIQGQAEPQHPLHMQDGPSSQQSQQQLGLLMLQHQVAQHQHPLVSSPNLLQQPMAHQHQQLLTHHAQQQPTVHQQPEQQQRHMTTVHGMQQQHFHPHPQHTQVAHLRPHQQQQYMHHSPAQQQFAQQAQMQMQQLPQHLQQQLLHVDPHCGVHTPQRQLLHQQQHQQQQLYAMQQHVSSQQQQLHLQPHQLSQQQLQQPFLQQMQQQQQQRLLRQHQQHHETVPSAASQATTPMGMPPSSHNNGCSAVAVLQGPTVTPRFQIMRGTPPSHSKSAAASGSPASLGTAGFMDVGAVLAARPGTASTVTDLMREAIEAAETAGDATECFGEVREADVGFGEDDLLDITEDSERCSNGVKVEDDAGGPHYHSDIQLAALMEAFLNPAVAVAAQTLEVTVQLVLDFIDELVAKGIEARRHREEGTDYSGPRPQLNVDDLLVAVRTHPRKALRCREALEHYRQLGAFTCAFRDERYLSGQGGQTPSCASAPQRGGTPAAGQGTILQSQRSPNLVPMPSSYQSLAVKPESSPGMMRGAKPAGGFIARSQMSCVPTQCQNGGGMDPGQAGRAEQPSLNHLKPSLTNKGLASLPKDNNHF